MINGDTKLSELIADDNSSALFHYNKNHGKDGRFASGDGDGDGEVGDSSNSSNKKGGKRKQSTTEQAARLAKEGVDSVNSAVSNMQTIKGKAIYKNHYKNLSDDELNKQVNRLSKEHQLSDLKGDTKYVKSGGDRLREILQTVGATLSVVASSVGIYFLVKNRGKGGK